MQVPRGEKHNFAFVVCVCSLWFVVSDLVKIKIPTSVMIFIAYIYKYNPTYRVNFTANPIRETKNQI